MSVFYRVNIPLFPQMLVSWGGLSTTGSLFHQMNTGNLCVQLTASGGVGEGSLPGPS